jgi:hypothetical protein
MSARREGIVWQALGFLVVMAAAWQVRISMQDFVTALNQRVAGALDLIWPFAAGIFAGVLLLAGAAAMISGHVLWVFQGGKHRGWMWKLAGAFCCFAGIVAMLVKMTPMAMLRGVSPGQQHEEFFGMVMSGSFAIALSGGYLLLLGVMLLLADRLGTNIRRGTIIPVRTAAASPLVQPVSG